jgi:cation:H+ antiporter
MSGPKPSSAARTATLRPTKSGGYSTRLGLSEALLGIVAALAADAPEVTAAAAAMSGRQQRLAVGVVIGSNVFNLAALLGLGAVVAGRIGLHRKVVLLAGTAARAVGRR